MAAKNLWFKDTVSIANILNIIWLSESMLYLATMQC